MEEIKRKTLCSTSHAMRSTHIVDLDQRPGFSTISDVIPALVTHGLLYSVEKDAYLAASEHLDVMGVAADSPLRAEGVFTESAVKKLAGNAMSIPTVGSLLLYIFANLEVLGCTADAGENDAT